MKKRDDRHILSSEYIYRLAEILLGKERAAKHYTYPGQDGSEPTDNQDSDGLENLIAPQTERETTTMPRKTKEENAMLKALREAGGAVFQESSIERGGTKLKLPANMTPRRAIQTLEAYEAAEEETTA